MTVRRVRLNSNRRVPSRDLAPPSIPSLQDPVLATHLLHPQRIQVSALIVIVQNKLIPIWVVALDEIYLPLAWPALHGFFLGYGIGDKVMAFKPDEARDVVLCCKAIRIIVGFVLLKTPRKVTRHAEINSGVLSVAEQINITIAHRRRLQEMGYKDKPCNDVGGRLGYLIIAAHIIYPLALPPIPSLQDPVLATHLPRYRQKVF